MFELYNLCLQSSFASQILSFISLLEVIFVLVPMLLSVAFITVAERKTMASMQRRLGPNIVGYYGLLQAFADALKLLLKEYISPTQANKFLFFLGPVVTLVFSLLGFSVIPFAPGAMISDFNLGILYMLAMSSLSTYGILLSGWSANSKYAFLGSLRSTAQLISYELILSSAILLVILFSGSLSLTVNIEAQKAIWYAIPLFPVFIIFFIGSVAETNRAPFDLVEAESELVSGYMTEHAAVVFVFFFLAEYASILLICILSSMLFLGGYLPVSNIMDFILSDHTKTVPYIKSIHGDKMENRILSPLEIETIKSAVNNPINTFVNEPDIESQTITYKDYQPHNLNNSKDNILLPDNWSSSVQNMEDRTQEKYYRLKSLRQDSDNLFNSNTKLHDKKPHGYDRYTMYTQDRIVEPIARLPEHHNNSKVDWKEVWKRASDLECTKQEQKQKQISFMYPEYYSISKSYTPNPILNGVLHSVILGVKSCIMIFIFIWTRASYPRIRYDQLMSFCWTILLPLIIAIIILLPCILYSFAILPNNVFLL